MVFFFFLAGGGGFDTNIYCTVHMQLQIPVPPNPAVDFCPKAVVPKPVDVFPKRLPAEELVAVGRPVKAVVPVAPLLRPAS